MDNVKAPMSTLQGVCWHHEREMPDVEVALTYIQWILQVILRIFLHSPTTNLKQLHSMMGTQDVFEEMVSLSSTFIVHCDEDRVRV